MVANAGVCTTASVLDCPFSQPKLSPSHAYYLHFSQTRSNNGTARLLSTPRDIPLLPIWCKADGQTGSRGEDYRILVFCWETRHVSVLLSSETLIDGSPGVRMMSLYSATKSAIRGLTQGAGECHWIFGGHASYRARNSPRSGKVRNHC